MTFTKRTHKTYQPEIDGLRALAIICVVLFHAGINAFEGGYIGVDIFFVISGYLIANLIIRELINDSFSFFEFYERRARRILPAIIFVTFICIPIAIYLMPPNHLTTFSRSIGSLALFGSNFFFWWETSYFSINSDLIPMLHTWSLSVEEQYYAIFPVLFVFLWNRGIKALYLFLFLIFLGSLITAIISTSPSVHPKIYSSAFYLLPSRIWELFVGVGASLYLNTKPTIKRFTGEIFSFIGLFLIIASLIIIDEDTPVPSAIFLFPTLGTAMLLLFSTYSTVITSILTNRFIRHIGLISYGIYLWHYPFFSFFRYTGADLSLSINVITICIISVIFADLSWRFIENPIRHGAILKGKKFFVSMTVATLTLVTIAGVIGFSNGFINLYNKESQEIYNSFNLKDQSNAEFFENHHLKPFEKVYEKHNILLIGDSFAEELTAALYQSKRIDDISLSTFYISAECGILYRDLSDNSDMTSKGFCDAEERGLYNKKLLNLMHETDEIWLASAWNVEFTKELEKTLKKLINNNSPITFFGRKHFGEVSEIHYRQHGLSRWLELPDSEKYIQDRKNAHNVKEIVMSLPIRFIDTQSLLCSGKDSCPNYDGVGLITHDGAHLTSYGIRKLNEALIKANFYR